jgi:hypothetical protein
MSVKIDLPPSIEESLAAQAAAQGLPLDDYVRHVLEEQAARRKESPLSPAERANYWRESAGGLAGTKPLSDEAISRETIYDERG